MASHTEVAAVTTLTLLVLVNTKCAAGETIDQNRAGKDYKLQLNPILQFDSATTGPEERQDIYEFPEEPWRDTWSSSQDQSQYVQDNQHSHQHDPDPEHNNVAQKTDVAGKKRRAKVDPDEKVAPVFAPSLERLEVLGELDSLEFLKLLYFLFPFVIPMIFVPLLFCTMGVLLLPVPLLRRTIEERRLSGLNVLKHIDQIKY